MSIPTRTISFAVFDADSIALQGAVITARLSGYDVYQEQIVNRETETTTTDAAGHATLALFPNVLGERNTAYVFVIREPVTNRKIYQTVAQVQDYDSSLSDIAGNTGPAVAALAVEDTDVDDGYY